MKPETQVDVVESYAIFQTGGKQYQAIAGKTVAVEKLDAQLGDTVTFDEVLLRKATAGTDGHVELGQPFLSTPVKAIVLKHILGPKIIVFKFKRRKKYKKKQGHRQPATVLRIESI